MAVEMPDSSIEYALQASCDGNGAAVNGSCDEPALALPPLHAAELPPAAQQGGGGSAQQAPAASRLGRLRLAWVHQ